MKRLVIVGRVRDGAYGQALELIRKGPPFDPEVRGFEHHAIYLSEGEVIFVFEAEEVEERVLDLVGEFGSQALHEALDDWRPLLEDEPRIAAEEYAWERE
jgi:hypothetical protein